MIEKWFTITLFTIQTTHIPCRYCDKTDWKTNSCNINSRYAINTYRQVRNTRGETCFCTDLYEESSRSVALYGALFPRSGKKFISYEYTPFNCSHFNLPDLFYQVYFRLMSYLKICQSFVTMLKRCSFLLESP